MADMMIAQQGVLPKIDAVGDYQDARSTALNQNAAQMQQESQAFEQVAQMGLGVMGNKLDGQVDPERLNTMITLLGDNPIAQKLKDHPELLPVITRGSINVMKASNDQQQFDLAKQQLQMDLEKSHIELQQMKNPPPVFHSPLDVAYDPKTGKPIDGSSGSNGINGNSVDQQAYHILSTGDPSTYEYAQAYSALSQPTVTMQPDGKGGMVQVLTPRQLPQGTRPPTYKGSVDTPAPGGAPGAPSAPSVADSTAQAAPGTTLAPNGTTVTPIQGIHAQPTESQVRSGVLSDTLTAVAPTILQNFKVLGDPTGQLLGLAGPVGNVFQTPEYQKASAAMASALQTIVFQLSGANTGANEMRNTAASMTPAIGDKPDTLAFKKSLFISYIKSVADASKDPDKQAAAQKILDELPVQDKAEETKSFDGKTYYRIGKDWFEGE